MKNLKNIFKVATLLLVIALTACSKKNTAPAPTKTQLLTGHSWKMTGLIEKGVDDFGTYPDCYKDDILQFKEDGTLLSDNGTTHCNPNEPAVTSAFWSISPDETALTIKNAANDPGITHTIATLTAQTLDLRMGGGSDIVEQIYTAQ